MAGNTKRSKQCLECGGTIERPRLNQEQCSTACRTAFNNRRKERGVILYDLKMDERYNRSHPDHKRMRTYIDRLCHHWRCQDRQRQQRADPALVEPRPSWGDAWRFIDNNPWIKLLNRGVVAAGPMTRDSGRTVNVLPRA